MKPGPRRARCGFTLIEMMITIVVFLVFFAFIYSGIAGTIRVTLMESIRLDMDHSANEAFQRVAAYTRDAVLPVRNNSGSKTVFQKLLNDDTNGFGDNAAVWENHLFTGSNFLAFCTTVDGDGSGDRLDNNMVPYLGINRLPIGGGGQYSRRFCGGDRRRLQCGVGAHREYQSRPERHFPFNASGK